MIRVVATDLSCVLTGISDRVLHLLNSFPREFIEICLDLWILCTISMGKYKHLPYASLRLRNVHII